MELYKISEHYRQLQMLDELSKDDLDMLDQIAEDFNSKVISIASLIKNLESECEILDKEIEQLHKRSTSRKKKIESLKEYLASTFKECKRDKVSNALFDVTLRPSPCRLNIIDESVIPSEFIVRKEISSIDKNKIKDKLKQKEEVPGCELVQDRHIRINIYQG